MKLSRKIAICVLSAVVILSAMVLPSFAWSIDYTDGNITVLPDEFNIQFEGDGTVVDGKYYYYGINTQLIYPYDNNQWKDTLIRVELFSYNNTSSATCYVTPTGSTDRSWLYSVRGPVRSYGDASSTMGDLQIAVYLRNGYLACDVYSSIYCNDFRAEVMLEPDAEYIRRNFSSDIDDLIDGLNSQVTSLTNQVNTLNEQIAEKDATIIGLQNNNVLDGVFSGIGDGFSSIMTPLLSLSVGGVSLGNVIGVLFIIGAILLFILLINKLRGA